MPLSPKIAFVTEPFPVRSGSRDFEGPFHHFCSVADAINRSGSAITYIIATDDLIDYYDYTCKSIKGSALGFCQSWPNNWQSEWVDILNGKDEKQINIVSNILKNEGINIIFLWSKNDTIRKAAILAGIQIIHVELGPVRSPKSTSWIFDPRGIGPDSLISELIVQSRSDDYKESRSTLQLVDMCAGNIRPKSFCTKKRVLFPLQVEDDINNILWNPWENQAHSTAEILRQFSNRDDIELTIRQHPASQKDYSEIINDYYPNCNYDNGKAPIWNRLTEWDGVIHINSSLGFEARLLGLNVCILGASIFSKKITKFEASQKIEVFIKQICKHKLDLSFNSRILKLYNTLRKISLVDERIASKPSFYLKTALSLLNYSHGSEKWFESFGIEKVVDYLRVEGLDNDLSTLRVENHQRMVAIDNLSTKQKESDRNIDALLKENQIRIDEISILRNILI